MTTAQEKVRDMALEISNRYYVMCAYKQKNRDVIRIVAKECSLVHVDGILKALSVPPIEDKGHELYDSQIDFWNLVKKEIQEYD